MMAFVAYGSRVSSYESIRTRPSCSYMAVMSAIKRNIKNGKVVFHCQSPPFDDFDECVECDSNMNDKILIELAMMPISGLKTISAMLAPKCRKGAKCLACKIPDHTIAQHVPGYCDGRQRCNIRHPHMVCDHGKENVPVLVVPDGYTGPRRVKLVEGSPRGLELACLASRLDSEELRERWNITRDLMNANDENEQMYYQMRVEMRK